MHFNIYINDQLGAQLSAYAEKQGVTRNKVIRQALEMYMTYALKKWPDEVANFKGIPDFPAFEDSRHELKVAHEDPFA